MEKLVCTIFGAIIDNDHLRCPRLTGNPVFQSPAEQRERTFFIISRNDQTKRLGLGIIHGRGELSLPLARWTRRQTFYDREDFLMIRIESA